MADKYKIIFQQLSEQELKQFLQKNGCGDLVDVLINAKITNGKKFLDLTEIQIVMLKIPPISKKKLIKFLNEIKENPQNFFRNEKTEQRTLNRRQSLRTKNSFLQKLEEVISVPKLEVQPPNKKPQDTTLRKKRALTPPPEPIKTTNFQNDDFDPNDYLTPIDTRNFEENEYEPIPSEQIISNFSTNIKISQRPPLTLPRHSMDERGYILGPEKPKVVSSQAIFPRIKNNSTLHRPPKTIPPIPVPQFLEDDDKEVAYEPVDYAEEETSSISSGSTIYSTSVNNYENNDIKSENVITRNPRIFNIRNRPLPPLPTKTFNPKDVRKKENIEEPLEAYENIDDINKTSENILQSMQQKYNNEKFKAESELDNLIYSNEEPKIVYGNTEKISFADENFEKNPPKLKHDERYEKHLIVSKNTRKILPPLPDKIPQFTLNTSSDLDTEEDESEEYGSFLFNVNDEPFYRNTDRKGAKLLLQDLSDGAFLFRPSKRFFLSLTLKYQNSYINLGIEKSLNNRIRLNTTGDNLSPEFPTLSALVEYFTREHLTFEHQGKVIETCLRRILPRERF